MSEAKGSLIAEVQRRNVHRAAVFYAGAAWLLVQIATQVFPFFHIDEAVVRWIVIAVLIGFPFAMLFSWFYEWTPQGIRLESEIAHGGAALPGSGKKLDRAIIAVLGLAVLMLLADRLLLHSDLPSRQATASTTPERSIAVLPLINSTGDAANEYFSDGISEELIASLSRLSNLKVISRTSSFQFKGKADDSHSIGEKLGVEYLLEGSVRKSADRVRIAIALVKAADGANVWSDTYDRELKDIFAVQSEIAGGVADRLNVSLLERNANVIRTPSGVAPSNQNFDAYDALLLGDFHRQRASAEEVKRSIESYREAIRIDPNYALAYARLSGAYDLLASAFGVSANDVLENRRQSREAAERALQLDPDLADAHIAAGLNLLAVDLVRTEAEYRRALELAPQNSVVLSSLCFLYGALGRLDEAVELGRRAAVLDPLKSRYQLARVLIARGDYDEADAALRRTLELQPEAGRIRMQQSVIQLLRGHPDEALLTAAQERDPFWRTYALALASFAAGKREDADRQLDILVRDYASSGAAQIAIIHAQRHETDEMLRWLERAWEQQDQGVRLLLIDPFLRAYRNDPRFIAFAEKTGALPSTDAKP